MEINRECELWLQQFEKKDHQTARMLLKAFKFVTGPEFSSDLTHLLKSKIPRSETAALFVERELRSVRGGHPIRMYKEEKLSLGRGIPKRHRATGAALPVVSSPRNDRQDIGSEGIVATLVSGLARSHQRRFVIHPSAEEFRRIKVRHIVVVTDLVGSGRRVSRFLSSLWRVRSVRRWASSRLVKFWVLAFSATDAGKAVLKKHPTHPKLEIVCICPTVRGIHPNDTQEKIRNLCEQSASEEVMPLGFQDTGALIAFAHGCPNNAPVIFHKSFTIKGRTWKPLFPARVAHDTAVAAADSEIDPLILALETLGIKSFAHKSAFKRSRKSQKHLVILLAAVRKGHRHMESLSTATGLSLWAIAEAERTAQQQGLLDNNRRLTEPG
ncbi:MAG: hypothetical protein ABI728_10750, partial [Betaproteobacteria bacterium]